MTSLRLCVENRWLSGSTWSIEPSDSIQGDLSGLIWVICGQFLGWVGGLFAPLRLFAFAFKPVGVREFRIPNS